MKKIILCIVLIIVSLFTVLAGSFIYVTRYKTSLIDTSVCENTEYSLSLYSIGEPDFPFGYAHGKIVLCKGKETISETKIDAHNDGGGISAESWEVIWTDTYAKVILKGEEQPPQEWHLYFDGKTEQKNAPFIPPYSKAQKDLEINVLETEQNIPVFRFEAKEFIECFNERYRVYENCDYLLPLSDWVKINELSPYKQIDSVCYRFSINEKDFTQPNLCVYMSEDEKYIYEIELVFHDHDYRKETYDEFEKMSKITLKTIFLNIKDIDGLYEKLYKQTEINFWGDGKNGKSIDTLYCYDNIGVFGFYGAGTANICIIPVTDNILLNLKNDNTIIQDIE